MGKRSNQRKCRRRFFFLWGANLVLSTSKITGRQHPPARSEEQKQHRPTSNANDATTTAVCALLLKALAFALVVDGKLAAITKRQYRPHDNRGTKNKQKNRHAGERTHAHQPGQTPAARRP